MLLAMGTFVPMVVLHPSEILTTKGILVVIGLIISLTGIAFCGYAGIKKERDQGGAAGEITKISRISMKKGILICIISPILISTVNIGFALCGSLFDTATSMGAAENWVGNLYFVALFTTGGIVNMSYCVYLMGKNKTASNYKVKGSLKNFMLILLMSLIWISAFVLYGVGAIMMGTWGAIIGWSLFNIIGIAAANFWGIAQGEWKGASRGSKMTMAKGLVLLLISVAFFSYSGTF